MERVEGWEEVLRRGIVADWERDMAVQAAVLERETAVDRWRSLSSTIDTYAAYSLQPSPAPAPTRRPTADTAAGVHTPTDLRPEPASHHRHSPTPAPAPASYDKHSPAITPNPDHWQRHAPAPTRAPFSYHAHSPATAQDHRHSHALVPATGHGPRSGMSPNSDPHPPHPPPSPIRDPPPAPEPSPERPPAAPQTPLSRLQPLLRAEEARRRTLIQQERHEGAGLRDAHTLQRAECAGRLGIGAEWRRVLSEAACAAEEELLSREDVRRRVEVWQAGVLPAGPMPPLPTGPIARPCSPAPDAPNAPAPAPGPGHTHSPGPSHSPDTARELRRMQEWEGVLRRGIMSEQERGLIAHAGLWQRETMIARSGLAEERRRSLSAAAAAVAAAAAMVAAGSAAPLLLGRKTPPPLGMPPFALFGGSGGHQPVLTLQCQSPICPACALTCPLGAGEKQKEKDNE